MKFLNWFNTNFWDIIFWMSLIIIFGGWIGVFQLSEADKLYNCLVAIFSLATSDILREIKHGKY